MLRPLGVDRRALRGSDLRSGDRSKGEIALAWFWVAAWIALVQIFATDSFSASETSNIVGPLLRWLFPDAEATWIANVHFAIRKASHFVVYAILALLALHALRLAFDRSPAWLAAASLALALVIASIDEGRQIAARSRTGALSDVVLDMSGAASALLLAGVVRRIGSARK
jgi:VanZ family protein